MTFPWPRLKMLLMNRFTGFVLLAFLGYFSLHRKMPTGLLWDDENIFSHLVMALVPYIFSHMFRAARLVVLGAPSLKLRVRTLFLLHMHTSFIAPFLPFKLEELYRWQQLTLLSGRSVASLMVCLLLRTLDAAVLAFVCIGGIAVLDVTQPYLIVFLSLLSAVAITSLLVFILAPRGLSTIQNYMIKHHFSVRALWLLSWIDKMREGIAAAAAPMKQNWLLLFVLSVFVWLSECLTLVLLPDDLRHLGEVLIMVLSTALGGPKSVRVAFELTGQSYLVVTLMAAILLWPLLTLIYFRFRQPAADLSAKKQRPLSEAMPRRITLQGLRGDHGFYADSHL